MSATEMPPTEMPATDLPAEALAAVFGRPRAARDAVIRATRYTRPLPRAISSYFIHLTALCPVACRHCMYASDLTSKSIKDGLDKADIEAALALGDEGGAEKLTITGGGEPFLKVGHILRLVAAARVRRVEIVTAGHWAGTEARARSVLDRLAEAVESNPHRPELRLRLSLDRYHLTAPRPVPLSNHANVVRAWVDRPADVLLGFRGIEGDMGTLDADLAREVGGRIEVVDAWNRRLVLDGGAAVPMTFNVMRLSGSAEMLGAAERAPSRAIRDYYAPFEAADGRLVLATALNDAIRGEYRVGDDVAITLDSDGRFFVFAGTAPDRHQRLGTVGFAQAVALFFEDPITQLLAHDGLWQLLEIVRVLDPGRADRALAKNDVASLVDDLLATERLRLAVTLVAARRGLEAGRLALRPEAGTESGTGADTDTDADTGTLLAAIRSADPTGLAPFVGAGDA